MLQVPKLRMKFQVNRIVFPSNHTQEIEFPFQYVQKLKRIFVLGGSLDQTMGSPVIQHGADVSDIFTVNVYFLVYFEPCNDLLTSACKDSRLLIIHCKSIFLDYF